MSVRQSIRHFLFSEDSWLWQPNRPLLYWITTAVFMFAIAATVCDVLDIHPKYWFRFEVSKEKRQFQSNFLNEDRVYTLANGSLMVPDLQDKMPAGVHVEGSLPVYVTVDRSTFKSKALTRLSALPLDVLIVVIIWLFRRLALSAVGTPGTPGNPFVWSNVRRLRIIAVLIAMAPVVQAYSSVAEMELVSGALNEFSMLTWDATGMFVAFGISFALAALAEVFAAGIRLREDVEGLV